ncbi:hypothetical protein EYZ11_005332 [Aspergillus tanneri]|uniref:Uncharacterized protein n=1 Tax=Aspergillus tanneri TaxID=1220188 RepID=A0A4S3JIE1_9EURO|nr:uncharacterized protein ATNIH1004_001039 [Aspergillus tanneri]KAA8652135.1 hypothetical protein ATNIH1004_001039 [Aspergillus tanneri]THC95173.1 hypothetical protein EYZ11_005332 [Aspergillus tanneri]
MGNICSRSKNEPEPFSRPGRPLGSNPPQSTGGNSSGLRAPLPSKSNFGTPGRTLGDSSESGGRNFDARANAAIAAQKRAESATTGKGKLGSKLAAQKAQTQAQTLNDASLSERAARDADNAAATRRWD